MSRFDAPSPGGLVLLYHRVTQLATDPQLLAVTPEHFEQHLQVLDRVASPISLREMRAAATENELPDRAVAITFDDGYADNFCNAAALLEKYELPATVFATTGNIDRLDEFFWDELDRLILQPGKLSKELVLNCGRDGSMDCEQRTSDTGLRPVREVLISQDSCSRPSRRCTHGRVTGKRANVRHFYTGGCSDYSQEQWEEHRRWNVLEAATPGSRQQLYLDLCSLLHPMTSNARQSCLRQLREWSGLGSTGRISQRMMSATELRKLAWGGLIEIGAHTVTHPLLAVESEEQQRHEIEQSRRSLEAILDRPVTSFSYPFGSRRDYTPATVAAVAAAGFELACSNFTGQVSPDTDRYQLPRMIVRDWDGEEFGRRLEGWFAMTSTAKPASEVPRRAASAGATSGSSEYLRDRLGAGSTACGGATDG